MNTTGTAKSYQVSVTEVVEYRVTVTAVDRDAAMAQAIDDVIEAGDRHFFAVHERDAEVIPPQHAG